ncbi:xanthine dehydrogenase accessory protein XdhC [Martelella endophytica]|uniref:XdhC protein n=1 Tax=Martelella endophytica TaxID=1486262 RepID=A0A0D5LLU7_MAREN|nr:xanthine dehydrogenase accessory protein XdhC [Martelella endophytica]AJY44747.1 XdhC protein [Martelella endophytica]
MQEAAIFRQFLAENPDAVIVTVASVKGSTPREAGAVMVVSATSACGTIGGGQLEYMAIDHARAMLAGRPMERQLDIALGPEIGQCCGGRTLISFASADEQTTEALLAAMDAKEARQPAVFIFGGGHVGDALATALMPLPFHVTMVETRAEMLENLPDGIARRLSPMPEAEVANIPAGGAAVILTHDHALDFLIANEALRRDDLAYCGMIGSKTKRATYLSHARSESLSEHELARLTMPVGGRTIADKRPAVIAALVASELIYAIAAVKAGSLPA